MLDIEAIEARAKDATRFTMEARGAQDCLALVAELRRLRAVLAELKVLGVNVRHRLDTQQNPRLKLTYEGGLLLTALAAAKVEG